MRLRLRPQPETVDLDELELERELAELARRNRFRLIWRRFRKDVKRERRTLTAGMFFAILLGLVRVAEPWPLKIVLDQVLFRKPAHNALTRLFLVFGSQPTQILTAAAVALIALGILHGFSYYYQDYMLSSAAQSIVYAIRTRLYRHLHALPMAFHMRRQVGDTLVRLSSDIIMLRDVLIDSIVTIGSGVIMLVLMLTVMLIVDPLLTGVAVGVMPVVFAIAYVYGDRIRTRSRKQRKREGEVGALMHESLAAMSVVQLFGASEREHERFRQANRRSLKQGVKSVRLEARMNRATEIALAAGTVVVLWFGSIQAIHGHISPGELIVFISYLRAAYRPLRRGSKSLQRAAKALAAAERIAEVLAIEPEIRDSPDAIPAPRFSRALRFEGVSFSYSDGEQEPVLRDIDLELPAGSKIAIVGPTGSGKSTLLRLVPRLYDPTEGRVTLDGANLRDLTVDSVRAQVSVVEQEAVLMGLSIADNIRYGHPEASNEEVFAAAEAAGLGPAIDYLPEGLETVVSERGSSLSGGERQRVAIARALVRRTPILLLDEPTTGLDPATKRGVIDALIRLLQGASALIATHDLELAREADEVVVLAEGRIVARGSYDLLARDSDEFRELTQVLVSEGS